MAFQDLLITEIFHSIQGETSLSGIPFVFIRLTGCNLRCTYCDSSYSFKGGTRMTHAKVLEQVKQYPVRHVLLTGGEPLLQRGTLSLIHSLREHGYSVSIETHGEAPIEEVSALARIVMDIKTPGSRMNRMNFLKNIPHLKPEDEIKFVITSEEDYRWAKSILETVRIPTREVLFSPAIQAKNAPGTFEGIEPKRLAELILRDGLDVRFQLQIHKQIWGKDTIGV